MRRTAALIRMLHQVIHHDPRGHGRIQGFGAAAHGKTEAVGGFGLYGSGDAVALIADDQYERRGDFFAAVERFAVELGRENGETAGTERSQVGGKIFRKGEGQAENTAHG